MLFAKLVAPQVGHVGLQHATLKRAAESRITLFTAPPGYVCGDSLAAALNETSRPTLWLRLGPEDADPATLLLSLVAGARRLCADVGATTLEQMRQRPGPTAGWPPLFARLGQELAEALPASTTLVLEHVHHLADAHPTLELLGV
jgi:ATP/maltotriose-dependent transcriptional regulator MalT